MKLTFENLKFDTDPYVPFSFEGDLFADGVEVALVCYNGGNVRYYYNCQEHLKSVQGSMDNLDEYLLHLAAFSQEGVR